MVQQAYKHTYPGHHVARDMWEQMVLHQQGTILGHGRYVKCVNMHVCSTM